MNHAWSQSPNQLAEWKFIPAHAASWLAGWLAGWLLSRSGSAVDFMKMSKCQKKPKVFLTFLMILWNTIKMSKKTKVFLTFGYWKCQKNHANNVKMSKKPCVFFTFQTISMSKDWLAGWLPSQRVAGWLVGWLANYLGTGPVRPSPHYA